MSLTTNEPKPRDLDPEEILGMHCDTLFEHVPDELVAKWCREFYVLIDVPDNIGQMAIEDGGPTRRGQTGIVGNTASTYFHKEWMKFREPRLKDFRQEQAAAARTRMAMGHGVGA